MNILAQAVQHNYWPVYPPSTSRCAAVMKLASSDAMNRIALAISTASPTRFIMCSAARSESHSSFVNPSFFHSRSVALVRTQPGQIVLEQIFKGARTSGMHRVIVWMAAFLEMYDGMCGVT